MGGDLWRVPGVSPFFTERARERAPRILSFAAVGGAALLLSPTGELAMASEAAGLDLERIARLVRRMARRGRLSFEVGGMCIHAVPVVAGWWLCAVSHDLDPLVVVARLRRARDVLAMALVDGAPPDPDGAPPAGSAAQVARVRAR